MRYSVSPPAKATRPLAFNALFSTTTGEFNTANWRFNSTPEQHNRRSLTRPLVIVRSFSDSTGNFNTANGSRALTFNTTGDDNTAIGFHALFSNTTGTENTATGRDALFRNTIGFRQHGHRCGCAL